MLLSVSQLAALAANRDLKDLSLEEQHLSVIYHQEHLSDHVPSHSLDIHKPLDPRQLIDAAINGTPSAQDFQYALSVWANSRLLRKSVEEDIAVLVYIWEKCIALGIGINLGEGPNANSWETLADHWDKQEITDSALKSIILRSPFYLVATSPEGSTLPHLINRLVQCKRFKNNKTLQRLLMTVFQHACMALEESDKKLKK